MAPLAELIGESPAIGALRDQIRRLLQDRPGEARLPTILIEGETGTGKGLLAATLHRHGGRARGPFVDVNCAAIPESLLEAELFGFERGAFTDARVAKPGLFEKAHRGTLFLDEVGLIPNAMQAKLLKVIEDRVIRRLGSTRGERVDVWILAATNVDLAGAIRTGRFRDDLYHRLAVVTLRLPPLRERAGDVLLLAEHFLASACRDYGLPPKELAPAACAALRAHAWPGNVRELANVMERVALLSDTSRILPEMLALSKETTPPRLLATPPTPRISLDARVESWEREEVLRALEASRWNVVRAAAHLGIKRGTLRYRMVKHGLEPPTRRARPRPPASLPAAHPAAPLAVTRWESRLVALLQATARPVGADTATADFGRDFDVLVQKIESFGGRVEDAGPSRIVAAFGIDPVEDAPRRAALAAIAMRSALTRVPPADSRRAGAVITIHVEQCLVGYVSGRAQIDGDGKRKMAAMLEDLVIGAGSDAVLVTETARSFLSRRFDFDVQPGCDTGAGGGARLLGYHDHGFGMATLPGPFVGRERELDVLGARWRDALAGRGQVVAVVGEPGIGKSRLLFEFRRTLAGGRLTYFEGRGESFGGRVSYLPVIDLLKRYFCLDERDDPATTAAKATAALLALDPALEPDVTPVLALLDAPVADPRWATIDSSQRRQRTLDAVRRLVLRASQAQPALVVIEDLHWIDLETQAFLDGLAASLPAARLLMLVTYRPEYRPSIGSQASYTQLHLDPLAPARAEDLLRGLLGSDDALRPLARRLLERTGGNPLFLEESVRSLVETGGLVGGPGAFRPGRDVQALETPPTVRAVLAARVDRLPPDDRQLLQAAAVIGKDVPMALLQAIADVQEATLRCGLASLQAAEFVHETRILPDVELTFRHALTRDVTYDGLPPARRRELHARLVAAIEALFADRLGDQVERLAHHALRGGLGDKAVHYLRWAGTKAAMRSALHDARRWLEQAIEVLEGLPETASTLAQGFEIRLELRPVLSPLGDVRGAMARLREAETLARRLNDDGRHGRVYAVMTNIHSLLGELDGALVTGSRALEIAGRLGDARLRIVSTGFLGQAYYFRGEYERVVELDTGNLAALPAEWVLDYFGNVAPPSVWDRLWLVLSLAHLGRFAEAEKVAGVALHLAEPTQHAPTIGWAQVAVSVLHLVKGEWAKACPPIEQWRRVEMSGNVVVLHPLVAASAWALAQLGEASEALDRVRQGEQILARLAASGTVAQSAWAYHALGRACLALGRVDEAQRLAERAVETSPTHLGFRADALHLLGDIATHPDRLDADRGTVHYHEALALAGARGMRPLVAHCHLGLGKLYRRTRQHDEAAEHLADATQLYREMDMAFWLDTAEAEAKLSTTSPTTTRSRT